MWSAKQSLFSIIEDFLHPVQFLGQCVQKGAPIPCLGKARTCRIKKPPAAQRGVLLSQDELLPEVYGQNAQRHAGNSVQDGNPEIAVFYQAMGFQCKRGKRGEPAADPGLEEQHQARREQAVLPSSLTVWPVPISSCCCM